MGQHHLAAFVLRVLVVTLLLWLGGTGGAQARDTPAVSSASGVLRALVATHGYEFTANDDIEVVALGLLDVGGDGFADVIAHDVALWTAGGTPLAAVTVPRTGGDRMVGGYEYVTLETSVVLSAGQQYVLGASYCAQFGANTCGLDAAYTLSVVFSTDASITINNGRFGGFPTNPTLGFPGGVLPTNQARFGPNMLIAGVGSGDGDGIDDEIDGAFTAGFVDESDVFSSNFTDQHLAGTTFGSIVDRSDLTVTVVNNLAAGVILGASGGGTGTATVDACGLSGSLIALTDADSVAITCGSLIAETLVGPVEISLGTRVVVTVPAGAKVRISDLGGDTFLIENVGVSGTISVDEDGQMTSLGPEQRRSTGPTATPTPTRTETPTPVPTVSATPTATVTVTPSATGTPVPTASMTAHPTVAPTLRATPTPTATSTPDGSLCGEVARADCRQTLRGRQSVLTMKDRAVDARDQLLWRWAKGEATSKEAFGDPLTSTDYAFCLYDGSGVRVLRASVGSGGTCPGGGGGRPCWAIGTAGDRLLRYRDTSRTPDGVDRLVLRPGRDGRARIFLHGRGPNLVLPTLPMTLPVHAQLHASTGECWQATFSAAGVKKNRAGQLHGHAD